MALTTTYTGGRLGVTAGRVTAIDVGGSVIGVVSDPEGGNVTISPDGTLALVMPDAAQRGQTSFTVLVKNGEGTREMTVDLKLDAPKIENGWGGGDHYTLATGADDLSVIEPGENHRKVYVSESKAALSIADIAAREGVKQGVIDGEWLAAHPEYGGSEGMALDTEAGMRLWNEITGRFTDPSSHHLLFERGYDYDGTGTSHRPWHRGQFGAASDPGRRLGHRRTAGDRGPLGAVRRSSRRTSSCRDSTSSRAAASSAPART